MLTYLNIFMCGREANKEREFDYIAERGLIVPGPEDVKWREGSKV